MGTTDDGAATSYLAGLADVPPAFAAQARRMPSLLRRLLVDSEPPAAISALTVLLASGLERAQIAAARLDLARPASEMLLRQPAVLDTAACAALRSAVDEKARKWEGGYWCRPSERNGKDTVDGLLEHQINLSRERLRSLIGDPALLRLTRDLPTRFEAKRDGVTCGPSRSRQHRLADECMCGAASNLVVSQAFVRRYTAHTRPWFTFHVDTASLTANIALEADAAHCGGVLLALLEGSVTPIVRGEGEASVHPSTLMHGVTRMRQGTRYALVVFFADRESVSEPW